MHVYKRLEKQTDLPLGEGQEHARVHVPEVRRALHHCVDEAADAVSGKHLVCLRVCVCMCVRVCVNVKWWWAGETTRTAPPYMLPNESLTLPAGWRA